MEIREVMNPLMTLSQNRHLFHTIFRVINVMYYFIVVITIACYFGNYLNSFYRKNTVLYIYWILCCVSYLVSLFILIGFNQKYAIIIYPINIINGICKFIVVLILIYQYANRDIYLEYIKLVTVIICVEFMMIGHFLLLTALITYELKDLHNMTETNDSTSSDSSQHLSDDDHN